MITRVHIEMDQYWLQEYENLVQLIEKHESQMNALNDHLKDFSVDEIWKRIESLRKDYQLILSKHRQFRKAFRDLYRHGIRIAGAHRRFNYVAFLRSQLKTNLHLLLHNCDNYIV